jgi:hypothetical protein
MISDDSCSSKENLVWTRKACLPIFFSLDTTPHRWGPNVLFVAPATVRAGQRMLKQCFEPARGHDEI